MQIKEYANQNFKPGTMPYIQLVILLNVGLESLCSQVAYTRKVLDNETILLIEIH